MGGAKAILATVTNAEAMQAIAGGLGPNGVLMVIGAVGPLTVNSFELITKSASVKGWYSGIARDSEDTLAFSKLNGVASMNEVYPLDKAQEAYERMMSGKARFRVVLRMDAVSGGPRTRMREFEARLPQRCCRNRLDSAIPFRQGASRMRSRKLRRS